MTALQEIDIDDVSKSAAATAVLNGNNNNNDKTMEIDTTTTTTNAIVVESSLNQIKQEKQQQQKYRMIALDLDGTLLNSNHTMADIQAEYLRNLHQQGMTICIATGRSAPSVYASVKKLQIPQPLPVVCSNGARGFLCEYQNNNNNNNNDDDLMIVKKTELFYNPVPKSIVERSIQIIKEHGYAIQYYYEDDIYCNPTLPKHFELSALYMKLTGSHVHYVQDDFASLLEQNHLPSKLLVIFDESQIQTAIQIFESAFSSSSSSSSSSSDNNNNNNNDDNKRNDDTTANANADAAAASIILGSMDWFLEILNPMVTKGHGLMNMCKALNISPNECIAMGDGPNDVEFLEMAGLGIAMKNAKDSVKQRADYTAEWTNDEHGVMKTLEQLKLKDQLLILTNVSNN